MPTPPTTSSTRHIVQVEADGQPITSVELLDEARADAVAETVLRAVEQRTPVRIELFEIGEATEQHTGTMVFDPAGCTTVVVRRFSVSDAAGAANFKR
jgi:hypothetical protein